jgi:hypothetical protein
VHDDPQNSQPSVVNEDLVHAVEEKISTEQMIHHFVTFPAFSTNFTAISS